MLNYEELYGMIIKDMESIDKYGLFINSVWEVKY